MRMAMLCCDMLTHIRKIYLLLFCNTKNYSIQDREMKVCHFTTRHCKQQVVSHRDVCEAPLWCCICASFPSTHTKMLSKQTRKNRFCKCMNVAPQPSYKLLHDACVVRSLKTFSHPQSTSVLRAHSTLACVTSVSFAQTIGKQETANFNWLFPLITACFFISTRI